MFTKTEIEVANKTSRASGAVGFKALVPRYIREHVSPSQSILDFGAGKKAIHTQQLREEGFEVTAYEFGDNIDPTIHSTRALDTDYDVVYASNVLNVQSSKEMLEKTLTQISSVLEKGGEFYGNYPQSPRKMDMSVKELKNIILNFFSSVERVGGTSQAPLFRMVK